MRGGLRFAIGIWALSVFGICHANGVVCRVSDTTQISAILAQYPQIQAFDQAGSSPFVRFEVPPDQVDFVENSLDHDPRIVWVEDECDYSSPEQQSSHGSSVAAIWTRTGSYARNTQIWQQINFTPTTILQRTSLIRVGIVDTGVSPLQPAIRSHIDAAQSFVASSATIDDLPQGLDTNNDGVPDEGAGHGTMIAGIILQLCPGTRLVVAKSADSDGMATSWSVLKGVVFCVENRSKIINLSLGSTKPLTGFGDFLDWVEQAGVLVVSPIGNDNLNQSLFPAAYSKVICAAGLLPDSTKAPFSNWSSTARVSGPATGILSAWYDGKSAIWSGTSFVAPIVTGCLAAALPITPPATPNTIRNAIKATGKNIDTLNPSFHGQLGTLLDFGALLTYLKKN